MPKNPLCDAPIIGNDGNIFAVLGICIESLRKAGFRDEAAELKKRVYSEASSYEEALVICMEYINPTEAQ